MLARPVLPNLPLFAWRPEVALTALGIVLFGWRIAPIGLLGLVAESWNTPVLGSNVGFVVSDSLLDFLTAGLVAGTIQFSLKGRRTWGTTSDVIYLFVAAVLASKLSALSSFIFVKHVEVSPYVFGWLSVCSPMIAILPAGMILRNWWESDPRPDLLQFLHSGSRVAVVAAQYASLLLVAAYVVIFKVQNGAADVFPIFIPVFWMALTGGLSATALAVLLVQLILVGGSAFSGSHLTTFGDVHITSIVTGICGLVAGSLISARKEMEGRLREQEQVLRRQLAESQMIRRLTDTIIGTQHEGDLFDMGSEAIGTQLAADHVFLLRIGGTDEPPQILSHWGLDGASSHSALSLFSGAKLQHLWELLSNRKSIVSYSESPNAELLGKKLDLPLHGEASIESLLLHPFAFEPGAFYVLAALTLDRPRLWLEEDTSFVAAVCDQVTLALQRMKLVVEREARTREFAQMSQALVANTGDSFFLNLTYRLTEAAGAPIAYLIKVEDDGETALPMALIQFGEHIPLPPYKIKGTPAEAVIKEGSIAMRDGAMDRFPRMREVFSFEARGFAGIRLNNPVGQPLGTLCVLSDQPIDDPDHVVSVLRLFATRVAAEIERDKRERKLRESEASYRRLLETAREGIAITDSGGRIQYANAEIASLIGCSTGDLIGKTMAEQFALEDQSLLNSREGSRGKMQQLDLRLQRRDGSVAWTLVALSPILNDQDEFQGTLAMITDISERKQFEQDLEERVRERTAELLASNQELEAFCYSISHDLRQPLRAIDGFSRAVIEDAAEQLGPESVEHLNRVRKAANRMSDLIDALLKLSRLNRVEMVREKVDLTAMAESLFQDLVRANPARANGYSIRKGMTCRGDAKLLRIVLDNLLNNAWKFSSKVEEPFIEVGYAKSGGKNAFFVKDNGIGFDMAYEDKLFRAFERLHSDAEYSGTGIGLATVSRVIQRHGGEIWAESAPGKGATFYFTLP